MSLPEPKVIRLLIVDDHQVVRAGLRSLLASRPQFEVAGEADSVPAAVKEAARLRPDVILMDARMPEGTGAEACRQIRKLQIPSRILFISSFEEEAVVLEAINAGADGYLLKDCDAETLASAIENIQAGRSVIDPAVTRQVLGRIKEPAQPAPQTKFSQLAAQEKRVIALVAQGKTNKEIAVDLGLSDKTVKNYLSNALEKLQLTRRSQAAVFFVQHAESKA